MAALISPGVKGLILGVFFCILSNLPAFSFPIIWTEETYTLPKGIIGYWPALYTTFYSEDYDSTGKAAPFSGARSLAEFWLEHQLYFSPTERFTLRLVWPTVISTDVSNTGIRQEITGFHDFQLVGLYRFLDEGESSPAVAGLLGLKLPTGNYARSLGTGSYDLSLMFIADKRFGRLKIYGNLGYVYTSDFRDATLSPPARKDPGDKLQYNLAIDYLLGDRLFLVGELIGESGGETKVDGLPAGDASTTISFIPEINYVLTKNLILVSGIQIPWLVRKTSGSSGITSIAGVLYIF